MSIQTLGDLIQVKRYEKRLTLWQLAQKMGIASALVRAWEDGACMPNDEQTMFLKRILDFGNSEVQALTSWPLVIS